MSDLQKYITKRKKTDKEFAKDYDKGFENFKIGVFFVKRGERRHHAGRDCSKAKHEKIGNFSNRKLLGEKKTAKAVKQNSDSEKNQAAF